MKISLPARRPFSFHSVIHSHGWYQLAPNLWDDERQMLTRVDTEAVSNVSKGFYGGQPVGPREVEAVFGRWGRFKSLAYWFWDWEGQQQTPMEADEQRGKAATHKN